MIINVLNGKQIQIDDEDYCHTLGNKPQIGRDGLVYVAWGVNGKRHRRALHRLIMNAPKGLEVDHINGDRLDNRRINLRLCTRQQNACNRGPQKKILNLTKFKGVVYYGYEPPIGKKWPRKRRVRKRWMARIGSGSTGSIKTIGYFFTQEEAARAYDKAAIEWYGEFARLNFPMDS